MKKAFIKLRETCHLIETKVDPINNTVKLNGNDYCANELSWDVPISGTVYGTLLNYKGAVAKLGDMFQKPPYKEPPKAPVLFIKPKNTFNSYGMPIPLPFDVRELEVGATLGVVIGETATQVSKEQALQYIQGYTVVNDISVPHKNIYRPAIKEKARDGFCSIGPWIVDRGAVNDPDNLMIRVYINNELQQENTTANLIRSVAQLIADVTDFMTLYEGDILLVGVPEGAPLVKAGDHIKIEIENIGTLKNKVIHEKDFMIGGK